MSCSVAFDAFVLSLYVNGVEATNDDNITIFDQIGVNRMFTFTDIEREDNGLNVSCRSSNGGTFSPTITLQVLCKLFHEHTV